MDGFQDIALGKMPDLMKVFDTFEEGVMKMVDVAGTLSGVGLPGRAIWSRRGRCGCSRTSPG